MNVIERGQRFGAETPRGNFKRSPLPLPEGNTFVRMLTARAIAKLQERSASEVAAEMWPSDRLIAALLARGATAPAMTTVTGWAAELAQRRVADAIAALGPASAGAEILKRGLLLNFDGRAQISAPGFVAEFGNGGFVAEGQPIPVRQLNATPALMQPHKLASIAVLTREMLESSNAEVLIADALTRAAGRMLDEVLFDANPEDAARPAGLRRGIAALTPSANADSGYAALEDITALIGSLAPVAGNGPYIIVASPGRAVMMASHFPGGVGTNVIVLGSSAVINDILAIAPDALVAALEPDPQIETATSATLHMDTVPQTISGTSTPHRSLFQTESIALKLRWPVSWALRDPRGFAWLTPTWK